MQREASDYEAWEFISRGGFRGDELPEAVDGEGRPLRRHTVTAGTRSLADIAERELGNAKRAKDIVRINRTTILDADRFYADQIINLPVDRPHLDNWIKQTSRTDDLLGRLRTAA